jgi:transposase
MTERVFKSGFDRQQFSLLPPRVDDYVSADNPVRAIDAYVEALDLARLGFRHSDRMVGAGQPPYDPGDLLRLYLYGYINQVRSSRRLEREAVRNLELIWLLKGLRPGYRTIAKFRQENAAALKAANRDFVLLLRSLELTGGDLVAIDGAFFDGNASKSSILTQGHLNKQLVAIEADIAAYVSSLDAADSEEDTGWREPPEGGHGGGDPGSAMAALMERRARLLAEREKMKASGQTQVSRTDEDARLLSKSGQRLAGYNVQIAVDEKHKLIVASAVVNDGNDSRQLSPLAVAARDALGVTGLTALADAGYYSADQLEACELAGIDAYVPISGKRGRPVEPGRLARQDFIYEPAADIYRCPAGEDLRPRPRLKLVQGKPHRRYVPSGPVCSACALRARCVGVNGDTREILHALNQDAVERHRVRMETAHAEILMARRKAIAEHPFGTLKCRAGYRHFLVRGFEKVRGEWSLMALCYNFTRLLNILGIDRLIEVIASLLRRSFAPTLHRKRFNSHVTVPIADKMKSRLALLRCLEISLSPAT